VDLCCPDTVEHRVRRAIAAVAAGRAVVVVDDADRENEGDLIFAASLATPQLVAFTVRHTSGFLCVALPGETCDRLDLPPMRHHGEDRFQTAYRVTVDLRGTGTGISAAARSTTIAALAAPGSVATDFLRPGHVVPLLAQPGGVLDRPGHTEAAVDLARLAGLPAAGALCEIVSQERPGEMARGAELERFAKEHDLVLISIAELIQYRRRTEPQVRRVVTTSLPTEHGPFQAVGYAGLTDGAEHMALVAGSIDGTSAEDVPVHVHTECLTGDVLRSTLCGCGRALDEAMARFAAEGRGVVVYLRPAGGARACKLLEAAEDDADTGAAAAAAAWILTDLGVRPFATTAEPGPARLDEWVAARRRLSAAPRRIAG
jgi:3,4-dihydroxy 2-butanone 4-phosphate synthase/GTP cyclohydrolase II